jgi:hypothetical protein
VWSAKDTLKTLVKLGDEDALAQLAAQLGTAREGESNMQKYTAEYAVL